MKKNLIFLFTLLGILILNSNSNAQSETKEAPNQEPEFPNQTRAPSITTQTSFNVSLLTDQLSFPWGLDFLPNGSMIISEKPGRIRIVSQKGVIKTPLKGIPEVRYEGSGGLFDVKLSPSFEKDRKVFWTYVSTKNGEAMNQVASGALSSDETEIQNVKVIYEIEPISGGRFHFGSRLLFDSEGMLLVTFGDRFRNGREKVQQMDSALGKIIRITPEGKPAPGNPFEGQTNTLPEIWSVGHRNPQGLAFHPETKELWEAEHGPRAGDEINQIKKGQNYGWPIVSYGIEYNGSPVNGTEITHQEGMVSPVYYYDPATAPSGISFYSGELIPEWKNNLFVAMLRGMSLARLKLDPESGRVIGEEKLLTEEKQRFRNVTQGPDGALYLLTDDEKGRLYRISN